MSETLSQQALHAIESAAADEKEHIMCEALALLREDKLDGASALTYWCRIEAVDVVAGRLVKASKRATLKAAKGQDS